MSYYCLDCGREFDEPEVIEETHGLSGPPYEKWDACPHCESSDYRSVVGHCSDCGEAIYYDEPDVITVHGGELLCPCCWDRMVYHAKF